ncbi:Manganese-transporting ATPase 13A1 [Orchesella cincta]|uniref:Manganese-transporting ATPase 13A1 n=1 Tax=Orchesella cincta TaxID=48709 RepID=A0A1D2MT87_ORCCI|nr:Manganese-transporting ATPase 13A1 [Orchesella cincta]
MSSVDPEELVESVSLYTPRPVLFHGYVWPFMFLYGAWAMIWTSWLEPESAFEAGMIGLAVILVLQTLVYLCCHWSVHVCAYLTCFRVSDPLKAKLAKVMPTPTNGSAELVKINRSKENDKIVVWIVFQELKYEWDFETKSFQAIRFPVRHMLKTYLNHKGYADDVEITNSSRKYGGNRTNMRIPTFQELFTERATAPFFVFQVFCVLLWCLDEYWMYSVFTLFMLVVFECTLVQQQIRNMSEIRNMGNKPYSIQVYRSRRWRPINSDEILPGDIVSVSRSQAEELIPCDMLLLRGPCIVDESMLTGESVPQMKEPIESEFPDGSSNEDRPIDLEVDGKLRILFGGTRIVQHTPPTKSATALRASDNGCVCYVLRTGFSTSQGKLLRTIMYGVKRVTANNLETFAFIMFLLIFAIAAAGYVWVKGTEDPERNRYKLFLECTLILTSVVPPELPIELSLAVNSSVLSLTKLGVFCTEPFRIPFAGKVEICCFDKTGTLTSDNLVIEGVAVATNGINSKPEPLSSLSPEAIQTLATCHALVTLDDGTVVGDPLEKVTLKWIEWDLNKDVVVPKKSGTSGLKGVKIFHRFHFSSALKRMSVVAGYADGLQTEYFAAVKGAPEIMKSMFAELPEQYDETYLSFTRRGARVLAVGNKRLGRLSSQDIRQLSRDEIESELKFLGFIIVSCPLKADSKAVMQEIMHSSHRAVMITGDNPLTACHVAKQLKMAAREVMLIFNPETLNWESVDGTVKHPFETANDRQLVSEYDLCVTGDGLSRIMMYQEKDLVSRLTRILPYVVVYARMAPKQKEWVINAIKSRGYCTLMCGDGTNDVGALKHAHVGVAILSHCPEWVEKKQKLLAELAERNKGKDPKEKDQTNGGDSRNNVVAGRAPPRVPTPAVSRPGGRRQAAGPGPGARGDAARDNGMERQLAKLMKELEEEERAQIVKLGDASIAAPFSSKMSSIECICHVIKQGRCTLVTTLQMFKILALNALVLAYSQSVLYLDGIKLSDSQATFHGLLLAACFFFISHSKPLKSLSKKRPLPNIFNAYTLLTVLLQFFVHFGVMMYLVRKSLEFAPEDRPEKVDLDKKFEPNLLNSTVYIISLALQITTFFVNYRGHPFMESISENKPFFYSVLMSFTAVVCLITRFMPDLCEQFEVVPIPYELQKSMLLVFVADLCLAYILDRGCMWLFGEGRLKM